jgi:4-carboxymuconolactone decarboxylase
VLLHDRQIKCGESLMTEPRKGLEIRRAVLGDKYVDSAVKRDDPFNAPIQGWMNDNVWGGIWARDDLDLRSRSLVIVGMLIALDRPRELALHLRGALRNGCTLSELREVLLQACAYCGAPAAADAFHVANEVLADEIAAAKAAL